MEVQGDEVEPIVEKENIVSDTRAGDRAAAVVEEEEELEEGLMDVEVEEEELEEKLIVVVEVSGVHSDQSFQAVQLEAGSY